MMRTDLPPLTSAGAPPAVLPEIGEPARPELQLVRTLCRALLLNGVSYCHWKSNDALDRSASGENDLDLLVDRAHATTFVQILTGLGFKEVRPPRRRQFPGVFHYYGLDAPTGRFVHVDAQYTLQLGDDTTKNVRLPMAGAYLASAEQGPMFAVPSPEFELAVYVVRLALKHGTWDAALFGLSGLRENERRELDHLGEAVDVETLREVVETHLPYVGWDCWSGYLEALLLAAPLRERIRTGSRLVSSLAGCARRPPALDTALRCWRRVEWGVRRYLLGQRATKSLVGGGALVAVVGGDGAGKTTAVAGLSTWLGGPLRVRRMHLGKPPPAPTTVVVKGLLFAARLLGLVRWLPHYPTESEHHYAFPGYPWLLWQVLTARDRRRHHRRARRLAARGHLVVSDRYPLPQITLMDGSRTGWIPRDALPALAARLVDHERRCYAEMAEPDVLLVLRVDPGIAVERKNGVDPEGFVRPRSAEVYAADWGSTNATVVDASRPADEVLAQMQAAVWERI
jgi:thymidylate kinase